MKSWFQKIFLTLFVLLQCVSPLVHAHIASADLVNYAASSGLNSPVHLHFDGMGTVAYAYDLSDYADAAQPSLENQSSPQVSMPQVNVRSEYSFDHDLAIVDLVAPPRAILFTRLVLYPSSPILRPAIHYYSAWSQAPPHAASRI
ncbi:MAG: hypothetical protein PHS51_04195 [Gallionella sp.]|nr:hypothetical protein [Gallionella sp.]